MTTVDTALLTKPLAGQRLVSVEKTDYTWSFTFTGKITIVTESLWRLLEGRVVVTSEDHLQRFGLPAHVDATERVLACTATRVVEQASISPSSRSEEHTSELQSLRHLVCRLLL